MFIALLFGSISAYGIYCDYFNRKNFRLNFWINNQTNEKKFLTGKIINDDCDNINRNPIHSVDLYNKKCIKYNIFSNDVPIFLNSKKNFLISPSSQIKKKDLEKLDYWKKTNISNYMSPHMKFYDYSLIIDKNTIIHHTKKKIIWTNCNKYTVEQYIPNNSTISIFATQKDNNLLVELIGSYDKVLKEIANKYYNISNSYTFMLYTTFGMSIVWFAMSYKRAKIFY